MRDSAVELGGPLEVLNSQYAALLQGVGTADRLTVGRALLAIAALWHLSSLRGSALESDPWTTLRNRAAHGPRATWVDEQISAIARNVEGDFPGLCDVFTDALLTEIGSLGTLTSAWLFALAEVARVGGRPSRAEFAAWFDSAVRNLVADGRDAAHVGTPPEIARLMVGLADLRPGLTILDPCCGVANALAAALDDAERGGFAVRCEGQEISVPNAALAHLRLFLRGAAAEVRTGDALQGLLGAREARGRQFDRALVDPPVAARVSVAELRALAASGALPIEIEGRPSAEALWLQLALSALGDVGRIVMFAPISIVFRSGGDARLREYLLRHDLVDAVISLPAGVLPWTSLQTAVIVVSKRERTAPPGHVLLGAVHGAAERRRGQSPLKRADVDEVLDGFRAQGNAVGAPGRVAWELTSVESLLASGGVLDPRRLLAPHPDDAEAAREAPSDRLDRVRRLEQEAALLAADMDELLGAWLRASQSASPPAPSRAPSPRAEVP